jgi:cobalt transporter subunit CbtB
MRDETPTPSVGREQEQLMTFSIARARLDAETLSIAFAALLGLSLVFVAGFANATVLHDAAHDQRHAIAFPCH